MPINKMPVSGLKVPMPSKSAISVRNRSISKKCGHKIIFKELVKERKDQHDLEASVVAQNNNVNQILNDI